MLSYTALVVLAHECWIALLARPPARDCFARRHRQLHDERRRELACRPLIAKLDPYDEAGEAVRLAHWLPPRASHAARLQYAGVRQDGRQPFRRHVVGCLWNPLAHTPGTLPSWQ